MNKAYYVVKFLIPRPLQIQLRRCLISWQQSKYADVWPIDDKAGSPPPGFAGWPDGKKFAFVLTHDVEKATSLAKCNQLADIEERLGFRSSFNFVCGDYPVPAAFRRQLTDRGFEIGVHGLHHNGDPFRSESFFMAQATEINRYLKEWGGVGFRSPSMYHNLQMLHHLDIEYDASTFDTDPFEPQPDGVGTIFPFWVAGNAGQKGYVELPYTLPQDFALFIIRQEKSCDIWKRKLDWITSQGGMALINTHPDYMSFNGTSRYEEYPVKYYEEFLEYIKEQYEGRYWNALPRDVSRFWASEYKSSQFSLPQTALSREPLNSLAHE